MATTTILKPARTLCAPPVNAPGNLKPYRPSKQLPDWLIEEARGTPKVDFDPAIHLKIQDPAQVYTMEQIGLAGEGISNTAASDPFSLFTPDAILQFRRELFSEAVLANSQYASAFATNMIRGYGPELAPFIFAAWHHPTVLAHISKIAGIELVPVLSWDVGHVNASVNNPEAARSRDEKLETDPDMCAYAWHRDSYPFVCVTMLSDCANMQGGETVMRTGNGSTVKVRGPTQGTAVIMQGRYIEHLALKAVGGRERISMVTSFRPKDAMAKDECVLTSIRPISEPNTLYSQFTSYRFKTLEERFRIMMERVQENKGKFDLQGVKDFLEEQKEYIDATMEELVEY